MCIGSREEVGRRWGAGQAVCLVQQICSVWKAEIAEIHLQNSSIVCHGIIHLPPANFFDSFQIIYKAARSVFLGLQNAQEIAEGQGQVEWNLSAKLH